MGAPEQKDPRRRRVAAAAGVLCLAIGAGSISAPAGIAVVVLAVAAFLVTSTRCGPVTLLTAYVALLVVVPARFVVGPLGAVGTPAVLIGLTAFGWWTASHLALAEGHPIDLQPIRIMVLGFLGLMLLAYGLGFTRPLDGVVVRSADRTAIAFVALAGVALLATDGIENRARLDTILRRLVLAVSFMAVVGIIQFLTGYDMSETLRLPGLRLNGELNAISDKLIVRRVSGTALHAIEFGVVLSVVLPIALHNAFMAPPGHRLTRWACLTTILIAIPMSVSRSAIVGLVVAMLMLLPAWSWPRRVNALGAMAVGAVLMRTAVPGLLGTIKSLFVGAPTDPSVLGRTEDYDSVFALFHQAPWFGGGLGTFLPEKYRYLDNQYLGTLVETGAVGLTALILLLVVGISVARGARRRSIDEETRHLGQALAASIATAAVTMATFDAFSFPINAGVLFLIIGCAGALWRFQSAPVVWSRETSGPQDAGPVRSAHRVAR